MIKKTVLICFIYFCMSNIANGIETGLCFNMGADAHLIKNIDFAPHMRDMKKILGIKR